MTLSLATSTKDPNINAIDKNHQLLELSGAQILVQALIDQGIKHIFGYPGGSVLDIYDALHEKNDILHVLVRHEQAAVHMADGYARATGDVGVVLVTSGPGATNAITGIATAYMDSIPLVIFSGQVLSHLIGNDAFQECDMVGISRPIVKHSFLVKDTKDLAEIIKKAFYLASTGRPGPVVVDLPKDILSPNKKYFYCYPKSIQMRSYNPTKEGHKGQIRRGLEALVQAKRPILYLGGGVVSANAYKLIKPFADHFNLPVTTSLMGLGAYPGQDHKFLGMLGMHGVYEANMAIHHSDLIFGIGVRFDDRTTNSLDKYCPNATVVHIDIDPSSISKTVHSDIPIVGDAHAILQRMITLIEEKKYPVDPDHLNIWWQQIEQWRDRKCLNYDHNSGTIKPQQVIEKVYEITHGNAIIASDVGQHQMFAALYYPFKRPRQWINSGGLGTMGFGLPAALGCKLALPEKTVVCITGDGSIQMNIQELSTALQYDIPVIIINLNNHFLGMVKQLQDMIYQGRHSHSYMDSVPNFAKIAEAYGHIGICIKELDKLDEELARAFSIKDKLVFVDIHIDQTENAYPMQIRGGGMNDMWLTKTTSTEMEDRS